jgi:hypothetical protein
MTPTNEFPSADEWQAIYLASPFPSILKLARGSYSPTRPPDTNIEAFAQQVSLSRLEVELHNRVVDVARSYVFMEYFHSQGIPDQRWYISPGRSGQSVEYFPDFQAHDFTIKSWFDFYGDTFYQKAFAAWAIVGHILNDMFSLGLKRKEIDFEPAVNRLAGENDALAIALTSVLQDSAFKQARQLRNDISHNEAPASVGMTISKSETDRVLAYTMGLKPYVTSTVIFENAGTVVLLLRKTLEVLPAERADA